MQSRKYPNYPIGCVTDMDKRFLFWKATSEGCISEDGTQLFVEPTFRDYLDVGIHS